MLIRGWLRYVMADKYGDDGEVDGEGDWESENGCTS